MNNPSPASRTSWARTGSPNSVVSYCTDRTVQFHPGPGPGPGAKLIAVAPYRPGRGDDGPVTVTWPALRRELSVSGPRTADDVWDRYVRPRRWPEWSPQIRGVEYPRETLAPGTTGVVRGPGGLPVRFQIIGLDDTGPVRTWSWTATAAGVQLTLMHTVEAAGRGTRTGLAVVGFAPAVLGYLPMAWWALRRLVH